MTPLQIITTLTPRDNIEEDINEGGKRLAIITTLTLDTLST